MIFLPILADETSRLDLIEIFRASPIIYSLLFVLSLFSFVLWSYSLLTLRQKLVTPPSFFGTIRDLIVEKQFDAALAHCREEHHLSAHILASGIAVHSQGKKAVLDALSTEGKKHGIILWQRIALLNDVAMLAPMLGLLGTVLGLFYAFYDVNRSPDTLASIFDGLGIAVGTTVAGLIVAILAMVFYASLKFKVVRILNNLENESLAIGNLVEKEMPQFNQGYAL